jgi:anti-sigma regulatory factor (Ser/Thr protein kinase)
VDDQHLPAQASAAATGRAFARSFCQRHALTEETTDAVVLLVSELVTNAYLHARSTTHLTLALRDRLIVIEASDNSPTPPTVQEPSRTRSGGRGLLLLENLGSRWGVRPDIDGKTIWVEIDDAPTAN